MIVFLSDIYKCLLRFLSQKMFTHTICIKEVGQWITEIMRLYMEYKCFISDLRVYNNISSIVLVPEESYEAREHRPYHRQSTLWTRWTKNICYSLIMINT